jgi:hypothetical protein
MKTLLVMGVVFFSSGCVSEVWCNPDAPSLQASAEAQSICKHGEPGNASDINVNPDPHALRGISGASGAPPTSIGQDPYEFAACMRKRGYRYLDKKECDASIVEK